MEATYEMKMSELMKSVTCEVVLTGVMSSKFRLVVGVLLFKLAVWVTGMRGEVMFGGKVLGEMK